MIYVLASLQVLTHVRIGHFPTKPTVSIAQARIQIIFNDSTFLVTYIAYAGVQRLDRSAENLYLEFMGGRFVNHRRIRKTFYKPACHVVFPQSEA